jgi:CDP-archaeol synthase
LNPNIALPDPVSCALFLAVTLGIAGIFHTAWLRWQGSRLFARPIDFGKRIRGKRIFGDNKMWRGLMLMPPAAAAVFALFAANRQMLPEWIEQGMWQLPVHQFALLGAVAGASFMLAELPNSFLKRQLDVAPGGAPRQPALAVFCFVLDRLDSVLGTLIVLSFLVPLTLATWAWTLFFGASMHALFSTLLYVLKLKARPL